jgi:hypothetical protein
LSANGGNGGGVMQGAVNLIQTQTTGGTATGGDINVAGNPGTSGILIGNAAAQSLGGDGGSSFFGGAAPGARNSAGNNGAFGGGGGGASRAQSTSAAAGGNGGNGRVIVELIF